MARNQLHFFGTLQKCDDAYSVRPAPGRPAAYLQHRVRREGDGIKSAESAREVGPAVSLCSCLSGNYGSSS